MREICTPGSDRGAGHKAFILNSVRGPGPTSHHVDHDWMMRCLEVRIKDSKLLRIIARMLKAGIMEEGEFTASMEGTPQGGIVSPVLANIYLHYVLDLWFERVIKRQLNGSAHIIRYCDDFVCCFQYETEARNFYQLLIQRLRKFNLHIAPEKSKIIEFGLFACQAARKQGRGKPAKRQHETRGC